MSREIKFRAWVSGHWLEDSLGTKMYYGFQDCMHWEFYDEIELMQYTGLKDKHGVEIYEGDILSFENGRNDLVQYDDAMFYLRYRYVALKHIEECEVIGNIHENPELLD